MEQVLAEDFPLHRPKVWSQDLSNATQKWFVGSVRIQVESLLQEAGHNSVRMLEASGRERRQIHAVNQLASDRRQPGRLSLNKPRRPRRSSEEAPQTVGPLVTENLA
ncbi:MAG: hypothetical protein JW395_2495 [Nitrospira sp.]|nr:hypothetical protein [Nitrospira sp.]